MATKRKPAIRKTKVEDYICTEKETIKVLCESNSKLSIILLGNGDPKKGMFYQFTEFMADHKRVVDDIREIKEGVVGLHTRADNNAAAAATAMSAIEKFKLETKSYDRGIKDRETAELIAIELAATKKRDRRQLVFWIIAAVVAILSVWIAAYSSLNNGRKIDDSNENKAWVDSLRAVQKRESTTVRSIPMDAIPTDKLKDSLRDDSLMKIYRK